jgi:acyl-coenzyme A thioesterase PaaI-like protein
VAEVAACELRTTERRAPPAEALPTLASMKTEEERERAAASLRALNHAFAAHDPADGALASLVETVDELTLVVNRASTRDRLALMRSSPDESVLGGSGFEDRAVGGKSNPTSVELEVRFKDEEVIADFVLQRAFEGAPGRAHGGIVAAAFDDVTGFVIGRLQEPAFTGELTVRYLAAVPVDQALEIRARLDGRERRKLFISAELRTGDEIVATCRAIYITVELSRFAGAPDPR